MTLAKTKAVSERLAYNRTIGVTAMQGRGLYYPMDSAIGADGRSYVLSRGSDADKRGVRVTAMNLDEDYYGTFGSYGREDGQFIWPSSIVIDKEQRLFISDEYLNRITVLSTDGDFIAKWGESGAGDGQLDGLSGLAFDSNNELVVVDHRNNRVQRFTADGRFLGKFGTAGSGEGEFNLPWGVCVGSQDNIYVADWGNDRVQKFTPSGEFVSVYGASGRGDGEFQRPAGVCVDGDGYIYVSDWANHRVQVLNPGGGFVQSLRGQATVSKWAQDFLDTNVEEAAARARANLDLPMEMFGGDSHEESAHIEKFFWAPTAITMDTDGHVYVVDSSRHRLQVYDVVRSSEGPAAR